MAADNDDEDTRDYFVVVNDEEQYSIWLADKPVPNGWRVVGEKQKKPGCLKYIAEVWTDMRPKSLRDEMAKEGSS
jgi:MbtH protein